MSSPSASELATEAARSAMARMSETACPVLTYLIVALMVASFGLLFWWAYRTMKQALGKT